MHRVRAYTFDFFAVFVIPDCSACLSFEFFICHLYNIK